ncbi:hypothetical protein B4U79_15593 [Dinothrombium tinctorium]|uniref:Small ribosomal subunit protein mS31 n=1 Tax=Dinothrombium tinctorium TaxID=1965070 RepID=A0A3S3PLE3_9ACAR|nr:hypothetical protein B4U79_15593 [Dinothrombium tinctorium]
MPKPEIVDANDVSKDLNERLLQAAKALSSKIGGEEAKKTESELVKMIQTNAEETINNALGIKKSLPDLSKVISGMSVDKKEKLIEPGRLVRSSEVDMDVGYKRKPPELMRGSITEGKVKGFMERGQPLGIFSQKMTPNPDEPKLETWDELARHELQTLITHTPENAYEEMIAWTEKGKLWQYPIDNEAGLDEERKVPFYEHVLLDEHLEGFPDKGPVRDFMEVMIIGLSKNPFMTASRKREYIDWFRQYFKDKESLIKASTAL